MSVYVICYAYNTLCIFEYIHLYVYEKLLFTYTHEKLLFTYTHTYIYKWKISKKTSEPKAKLMTHQRVKLYSSNVAPRMLAVENLRMSYRECSLLVPKFSHRSSPACGTSCRWVAQVCSVWVANWGRAFGRGARETSSQQRCCRCQYRGSNEAPLH